MENQKAVDSFVGSIGKIAALLNKLQDAVVDNHMGIAPEAVNWGHVGCVLHILDLLEDAACAAHIRSEH